MLSKVELADRRRLPPGVVRSGVCATASMGLMLGLRFNTPSPQSTPVKALPTVLGLS